MSKRSSRRKRRVQKKKQETRLTGPILVEQGETAFQQQDYRQAIDLWEQASHKPNASPSLPAALAEAYFRRAMEQPTSGLADLQQAVKLAPKDPRYAYHLALTRHRAGELDQAEAIYRRLLEQSPPYQRAAVPLVQLLIEQKRPLSKEPAWNLLSPAEQTQLAAAEALVKKKEASTLRRLAETPLDPLWRGLIAIALKDGACAGQNLEKAIEADTLADQPLGVAHYYLGVLAGEAGQHTEALSQWQSARSRGLNTGHLRQNLTSLAHHLATEAQQAGRTERAVELLEQYCSPDLLHQSELGQRLNWELAYQSAQKGDWKTALHRWQAAEAGGDDSRRLLFNLALAYQKTEQYQEAAEHWRTVLRRRPRKADDPDALNDKQVALVWQNVAENYSRAGDYEEAVKTFKNAVKWAPDNIDLRLKLVEAYQVEGRWQAAENEINRVLDKDPDHVPALTLLAESYSHDYFPERGREIWQRILTLEPNNPVARQQLAYTYERQGITYASWGNLATAIEIFKEGLEYTPNSQRLLSLVGSAYADKKELEQARHYFEQARVINPNDLSTLYSIYGTWLEFGSSPDLHQAFEHIKAVTTPIPGAFFLDLYEMCDDLGQRAEAQKVLEYAEKHYPNDETVQLGVAVAYLNQGQDSKGISILRAILKNNPRNAEANLHLGIAYFNLDQTRLAKRYWSRAESHARKDNNFLLLHRIQIVKDDLLHDIPPPRNPMDMLMNMPPEILDELAKDAPPEVAEMLRNKDMLELIMRMGSFGSDDDFDDDEEDFFYP